ncbi:hypothetical protein PR048_030398 [Dryococelus australis]|uniref:Uncharacterized protein n=1 Tax=Dryococelus australis TaxID=614101 RepID=A0ABQ9GBK8_9NEOP|nr:hypothetical protein PR048_030398 [Dryococelus australis]
MCGLNGSKCRKCDICCKLCRKRETSLCELCNFNTAFMKDIKDSVLKKDNCVKHVKSEIHKNALNAMSSVSGEKKYCIGKLVDIVYVLAEEEKAFNTFLKLFELKNTGVEISETCTTGFTDVSVTHKELVFVMFINKDTSAVKFKYLKSTDLPNSSASAIFNSLKEMVTEFGVENFGGGGGGEIVFL